MCGGGGGVDNVAQPTTTIDMPVCVFVNSCARTKEWMRRTRPSGPNRSQTLFPRLHAELWYYFIRVSICTVTGAPSVLFVQSAVTFDMYRSGCKSAGLRMYDFSATHKLHRQQRVLE